MSELEDLYQETVLDHGKRPRNFHEMADANHVADGHNPLCGDRLRVWVKVENNVIQDVSFQGQGCSISTASASMMSQAIKGKTVLEAQKLFESFHHMLTEARRRGPEAPDLGKLSAFGGVRRFPVRVKCATLPWHTLQAALKEGHGTASTE